MSLLEHLAGSMADPVVSATLAALVEAAERDPEIARLHHRHADSRRAALVATITDAIAAGEVPAGVDPELAAHALAGAVACRRLHTATPLHPDEISAP